MYLYDHINIYVILKNNITYHDPLLCLSTIDTGEC